MTQSLGVSDENSIDIDFDLARVSFYSSSARRRLFDMEGIRAVYLVFICSSLDWNFRVHTKFLQDDGAMKEKGKSYFSLLFSRHSTICFRVHRFYKKRQ